VSWQTCLARNSSRWGPFRPRGSVAGMNVSLIVANGRMLLDGDVHSERFIFQEFLPVVNHGAKARFVLKITEIIVADDDAIVVSGVLENKSAKNRRERWPIDVMPRANRSS
jgi:hypothetical protein